MGAKSPSELFDLSGRVAVVTGGSRGLGREMVRAFARAGADVVIASRKLDNCEALADEVRSTTGQQALAVECHVGYWEQNDALCERVYDEFGHCEVLVNNAGLSPLYPSLYEVSESLFDKVIEVNLKGPFRASAVFGKRMFEAGGGSIINVSSVAAVAPTPIETAYGAAKAGIHAITQSFAREYAPRVRVNCIMPGPFLTDISKAWDMDAFNERAATRNRFAARRRGRRGGGRSALLRLGGVELHHRIRAQGRRRQRLGNQLIAALAEPATKLIRRRAVRDQQTSRGFRPLLRGWRRSGRRGRKSARRGAGRSLPLRSRRWLDQPLPRQRQPEHG